MPRVTFNGIRLPLSPYLVHPYELREYNPVEGMLVVLHRAQQAPPQGLEGGMDLTLFARHQAQRYHVSIPTTFKVKVKEVNGSISNVTLEENLPFLPCFQSNFTTFLEQVEALESGVVNEKLGGGLEIGPGWHRFFFALRDGEGKLWRKWQIGSQNWLMVQEKLVTELSRTAGTENVKIVVEMECSRPSTPTPLDARHALRRYPLGRQTQAVLAPREQGNRLGSPAMIDSPLAVGLRCYRSSSGPVATTAGVPSATITFVVASKPQVLEEKSRKRAAGGNPRAATSGESREVADGDAQPAKKRECNIAGREAVPTTEGSDGLAIPRAH